jgi:hypothetical protein
MKVFNVRRCPECHSIPIRYTEFWRNHSISFDARPDGGAEEIGVLNEGSPYCVLATCKCGNGWRLRGVTQITDLRTERPSR